MYLGIWDPSPNNVTMRPEGGGSFVGPAPDPQLAAALQKIAAHIGSSKKFPKASGLLRELLVSGKLRRDAHGELAFIALSTSMRDPANAAEPDLRLGYQKLFTAASKSPGLFGARQLSHLDVLGVWAVLRTQLTATDDSFDFNRTLGRLKAMLAAMPLASAEDEALLAAEKSAAALEYEVAEQHTLPSELAEAAALPALPAEVGAETDPFGLDSLLEQPRATAAIQKPALPPPPELWVGRVLLDKRREALLECLESLKGVYSKPWARTSVDIAVQAAVEHSGRFSAAQRPRIAALDAWATAQKVVTRRGPSAAEARRDTTSFEAARRSWGSSTVSARGKVGGGGDHKSETWLG